MIKYFQIFFVSIMLISCSYNNEVVSMNEVNGTWDKKKELLFTMNIEDTSTPKNIIFVVRNNNDYPYSNLFLITYLKAENEKNFKIDTLNYIMAKPNGEWLGKGFGETKEILFQYKNQYKFPKKGKYIIGVKQGMRINSLVGIEDLGVKLENSTQP